MCLCESITRIVLAMQLFACFSDDVNLTDASEVGIFEALPKRLSVQGWLAFVTQAGISAVSGVLIRVMIP